ncbi:radical SAM protein [Pyrococcus sp. ST04]|uniref:radical SAM protein n=1 Tax=Pyrococcus sp. ST04 TaxID=1183377 RepID=UPI00026059B1|nr:radical SAM protein [Pyrococcus sp. ST04]AFK21858.1 putative Fe-S oxidoreductase [Pyrococcus sp. ST04]
MEKAKTISHEVPVSGARITTISKPPWVAIPHTGKLERIILLIGSGKGVFSDSSYIPRSIGCIGNNKITLYRERIPLEKFMKIIDEFAEIAKGGEVYITNYDSIEEAVRLAKYAASKDLKTYLIALFEDVQRIPKDRKFKVVCEIFFKELDSLNTINDHDIDVLLVIATYEQYRELVEKELDFAGEIWIDLLYPGSLRGLTFNPIEVRKVTNPTATQYNNCMAGLVAITPDGFAVPCPLLRKFVVGDITKESLRKILKKQRLKKFWKLTKDYIEGCNKCSLRYICHDCRALEYQATGDIFSMEFCLL